jgi:hypothetical protein
MLNADMLRYGEVSKNVFTILEVLIAFYPVRFAALDNDSRSLFLTAVKYSFQHDEQEVVECGLATLKAIAAFHISRQLQNAHSPFLGQLRPFMLDLFNIILTQRMGEARLRSIGAALLPLTVSDQKGYIAIANEVANQRASNDVEMLSKLKRAFQTLVTANHFTFELSNDSNEQRFQANLLSFVATVRGLMGIN